MAVSNLLLQGNYGFIGKITVLKLVRPTYQKLNKNYSDLHLEVITFTTTCAFALTETAGKSACSLFQKVKSIVLHSTYQHETRWKKFFTTCRGL